MFGQSIVPVEVRIHFRALVQIEKKSPSFTGRTVLVVLFEMRGLGNPRVSARPRSVDALE